MRQRQAIRWVPMDVFVHDDEAVPLWLGVRKADIVRRAGELLNGAKPAFVHEFFNNPKGFCAAVEFRNLPIDMSLDDPSCDRFIVGFAEPDSHTANEYKLLSVLQRLEIPAPHPVGHAQYGDRTLIYVSERVSGKNVRKAMAEGILVGDETSNLLAEIGQIFGRIHREAGPLYYADRNVPSLAEFHFEVLSKHLRELMSVRESTGRMHELREQIESNTADLIDEVRDEADWIEGSATTVLTACPLERIFYERDEISGAPLARSVRLGAYGHVRLGDPVADILPIRAGLAELGHSDQAVYGLMDDGFYSGYGLASAIHPLRWKAEVGAQLLDQFTTELIAETRLASQGVDDKHLEARRQRISSIADNFARTIELESRAG